MVGSMVPTSRANPTRPPAHRNEPIHLSSRPDHRYAPTMATNKTQPTEASIEDYLEARGSEEQRADCRALMAILQRVTKQKPKMWGPSIVGYGSYRYTYDSGRSGKACLAGFAIRGKELVVYVFAESEAQRALLAKLGKHRIGKSCLYFKRLSDLDSSVLEAIVAGSVAEIKRQYG